MRDRVTAPSPKDAVKFLRAGGTTLIRSVAMVGGLGATVSGVRAGKLSIASSSGKSASVSMGMTGVSGSIIDSSLSFSSSVNRSRSSVAVMRPCHSIH